MKARKLLDLGIEANDSRSTGQMETELKLRLNLQALTVFYGEMVQPKLLQECSMNDPKKIERLAALK